LEMTLSHDIKYIYFVEHLKNDELIPFMQHIKCIKIHKTNCVCPWAIFWTCVIFVVLLTLKQ